MSKCNSSINLITNIMISKFLQQLQQFISRDTMSNKTKTKEEVLEDFKNLNDQYNSLLQKNQNDLIKIKQKQKTFNQAIQNLKNQKNQMQQEYQLKIDNLMLELEKYKNSLSTNTQQNQEKRSLEQARLRMQELGKKRSQKETEDLQNQNSSLKKEIHELKTIVSLKSERVDHLEENVRKMMDQNIDLNEKAEKYKISNKTFENRIRELEQELKESKLNEQKRERKNFKEYGCVTEGDFIISKMQHETLLAEFNKRMINLNKELDDKEKEKENLKLRIGETNEELKRYMEKDKRNNAIIQRKNGEIQNAEKELENIKKIKMERRRVNSESSCLKCKEWDQENKLLKEMIKSLQTMVRVRQMEAERLKNRELMNESRTNGEKKSKTELPVLPSKKRLL